MKEKMFAASVKRENIMECEKLGLSLEEFATLAIASMLPISEELGL
jgi:predicted hydrolase (HD superfamily)